MASTSNTTSNASAGTSNAGTSNADYTKNNAATEFLSTIKELGDFYYLFESFKEDEIPSERREIILKNLTYRMLAAENEYSYKVMKTQVSI